MTIVQIAEGAFSVPSYSEVTIVPAFTLILGEPHDDDCEEGSDDPE